MKGWLSVWASEGTGVCRDNLTSHCGGCWPASCSSAAAAAAAALVEAAAAAAAAAT